MDIKKDMIVEILDLLAEFDLLIAVHDCTPEQKARRDEMQERVAYAQRMLLLALRAHSEK